MQLEAIVGSVAGKGNVRERQLEASMIGCAKLISGLLIGFVGSIGLLLFFILFGVPWLVRVLG